MTEVWPSVLSELRLLVGLLVAAVLSGLVGWEREAHRTGAGLRTHMLVGISSALFVVLAEQLIVQYGVSSSGVRFDLVGVLAAVVSGVSFLGAGTIFSSGRGERTRGLTTAASLLATAGVGVACGLHLYVFATGATVLFLFVLRPLQRMTERPKRPPQDADSLE
ncbi:putative Mg2+ transporter-C (MgtC) family protein [Deinococcus metalli]|uniref:Magnesium transporter n=1 Tax=Deinococcus metalli TaxID=1141878 RepID=A0A7W8KBZ4_9DEIO|nr:MgtC/SapB family protein [Deinococcus metalli]MBB5375387.1 putative Mg2+ transporter-C (MgtC) family protein [Deinococcus metalli]GHF29670.1 magnesium transporter [Deinococcus metalli]